MRAPARAPLTLTLSRLAVAAMPVGGLAVLQNGELKRRLARAQDDISIMQQREADRAVTSDESVCITVARGWTISEVGVWLNAQEFDVVWQVCVCVCVCACVRACVRPCVRACVRARVRTAYVRACAHEHHVFSHNWLRVNHFLF
jgi:hypothetical protein